MVSLADYRFFDQPNNLLTDGDEIAMPKGRPPGAKVEEENSDDDIPMPEGPPPGKPTLGICISPS